MSKAQTTPRGVDAGAEVIHLSELLGASVVTPSGDPIGRVEDIIVQLPKVDRTFRRSRITIVWDQLPHREWTDGCRNRLITDDPVS